MSMTLTQMITRVSELLEDTAGTRWGNNTDQTNANGVIARHLNDAQRDFVRGTRVMKKQSSALVVSSTTPTNAFYTLPSDFLELDESYDGAVRSDDRRLYPIERGQLGDLWQSVTGTPMNYLPLGEFGFTELRVYPYPAAALTGLKIFYAYLPADMTTGPITCTLPGIYHQALVWYAVAQALSTLGQYTNRDKAQIYMGMYERELADARARVARRFSSQAANVPYRNV